MVEENRLLFKINPDGKMSGVLGTSLAALQVLLSSMRDLMNEPINKDILTSATLQRLVQNRQSHYLELNNAIRSLEQLKILFQPVEDETIFERDRQYIRRLKSVFDRMDDDAVQTLLASLEAIYGKEESNGNAR